MVTASSMRDRRRARGEDASGVVNGMAENMSRAGERLVVPDGDRLLFYPDRRKMLRRVNARAAFILLPIAAGMFALFRFLDGLVPPSYSGLHVEFAVLPWTILGLYVALYAVMVAAVRRQRLPLVTLSPEGITVQTMLTPVGLLPWDEVAEVRPYTMIYRYVGIVPRDLEGLCRRLGGRRALLMRANSWVAPLYAALGVFVAPINVPQEYLPVTADDLVARIRDYRDALATGGNSAPRGAPGVWPPPPVPQARTEGT